MCAPVAPVFASRPQAPPPPARRRHRDRNEPRYKYGRKVKGLKFQARVWIPRPGHHHKGGWSVNLGLYENEVLMGRASREVVKRLGAMRVIDPLSIWLATKAAIVAGHVRADVLPMYVRRAADGRYVARAKVGEKVVELGPFDCPAEACGAMCRRLAG